jgi:hypothetical protein
VVTPLLSLMEDQIMKLKQWGVSFCDAESSGPFVVTSMLGTAPVDPLQSPAIINAEGGDRRVLR